jgi:ribosomal protein S18 acetylase RimI-like enzyme
MIVKGYKKDEMNRLLAISDACYHGDERPNKSQFYDMLKTSECFKWVDGSRFNIGEPIKGFALVNEHYCVCPYLWSICVIPYNQNSGIGTQLLEYVKAAYNDSPILLHCRADNPAQKWYFDHGFRVTDVEKDYYCIDGRYINGLRMRREPPATVS